MRGPGGSHSSAHVFLHSPDRLPTSAFVSRLVLHRKGVGRRFFLCRAVVTIGCVLNKNIPRRRDESVMLRYPGVERIMAGPNH